MSGRITIKSIARDLGISHMTVSRALSDHPNVKQHTREMIIKRASELGYVKSAAAKAMRGDRTNIVGLLLPNITNEFYARYANSMALACEDHSFQLIIHLTNDELALEQRAMDRLREVQARAVVVVPAPGEPKDENDFSNDMKIIHLIRHRKISRSATAIMVDDHQAICDAVVHLAQCGHSKIGYIGADVSLSSGRERLAAFEAGLAKARQNVDQSLMHHAAPSFKMGQNAARQLINQGSATALVCGGFEISNGALSALMAHNLKPSNDFAFVGYGDPSFYSWVDGGITTIQVPVKDLALKAVELVLDDKNEPINPSENPEKFPAVLKIR